MSNVSFLRQLLIITASPEDGRKFESHIQMKISGTVRLRNRCIIENIGDIFRC